MTLFTRLLLLEPGSFQTHPDMGVGLISKYRYSLEGSESALQADIRSQIDKYLPDFQAAEVNVRMVDKSFRIAISFDNYVFGFQYDTQENNIVRQYSKLSDL